MKIFLEREVPVIAPSLTSVEWLLEWVGSLTVGYFRRLDFGASTLSSGFVPTNAPSSTKIRFKKPESLMLVLWSVKASLTKNGGSEIKANAQVR